MTTLFTILIIIAAILLILVVLIQKSKGGGLASGFSSSNAILGVKKTTDGVEKATWVLAGVIIVLSIATVAITPKGGHRSAVSAPVQQQPTLPDMSSEDTPLLQIPADNNSGSAESSEGAAENN